MTEYREDDNVISVSNDADNIFSALLKWRWIMMEKVMAKDTKKYMTQGSPMKLILGFSVPLLFGMLFQQFYSMMDTIIVGRFLGVHALAT